MPSLQNYNVHMKLGHYIKSIKPLAWLILLGDSVHNFADGLALGAAISQSLSLGISTTIALVFHEVPHELGDFFILLDTGMSWYAALFFNFLSALTAVVGFFVGVAIGMSSEEANGWILSVAAGVFLYISLVDLVRGVVCWWELVWGVVFVVGVAIRVWSSGMVTLVGLTVVGWG